MKQKGKLFLNIATIALCLCAIAVGVYSAKTASLNVGGQIGFEAHNCDVDVMVSMYGHAIEEGGTPVASTSPTTLTSSAIQIRGADVDKTGANSIMPTKTYFTDASSDTNKPEDIVIKFALTNKSKFKVKASVTSATCENTTATKSSDVIMDELNGTNDEGEITVTLSLDATDGDYESFDSATLNIAIKFEKYSPYKFENQVQKFANGYTTGLSDVSGVTSTTTYAYAFPYYITMGEKEGTSLKWLVIGKMGLTSATVQPPKLVALDDDDKAALEAHSLLKDVDYVLLSEKTLVEKSGYGEYATSSIRTYLRDTTSDTGFATTYGLTDSLSLITSRNIQDMYTVDEKTFPTGSNSTEEDKFWLLSKTEVEDIFVEGVATTESTTYYMSARTTNLAGTSSDKWWLRAPCYVGDQQQGGPGPHPYDPPTTAGVNGQGVISNYDGSGPVGDLRPACII